MQHMALTPTRRGYINIKILRRIRNATEYAPSTIEQDLHLRRRLNIPMLFMQMLHEGIEIPKCRGWSTLLGAAEDAPEDANGTVAALGMNQLDLFNKYMRLG